MVLEKTLESPIHCKEIQPVHPKGNQSWIFTGRTDAEAETPILWPPDVKSWLISKDLNAGKDRRQEEKGTTEDEMVAWHHRLDGPKFEQAPEVGDGQERLVCCSSWGHKESDTTERLIWTNQGRAGYSCAKHLNSNGLWLLLFSCSVVSHPLQPHKLQHARLSCPSLSSGVCTNSCPLSWWCHSTVSCSVALFFSCLHSFPTSGSFPMSPLFESGGQRVGASTSASVLPMNIQGLFPLGLTGWISL